MRTRLDLSDPRSLCSNYIAELETGAEWGALGESLTSLTLSNNQLVALGPGALAALRRLARLELDGNRLRALAPRALPPGLALLRLDDNLLPAAPCAALAALPRLRHLHLRANRLRAQSRVACAPSGARLDSVDLGQNELDDGFELRLGGQSRPRRLVLDLNDFTAIPAFALAGGLQRLSMSHNRLGAVSEAAVRALGVDLERLELDHNELAVLPAGVRGLGRLRHLSLAYNRLREAPDLPPRLRYLSLAGNFLAEFPAGLDALAPGSLAHLELGYNRIVRVHAASFGAWAGALVTLGLRGNRIAQLAGDAFPAALPLRELELGFNELYHVDRGALAGLTSLRALELSSSLLSGEFPLAAPAGSLTWLTVDNNNVHYLSAEDLQNFPSLEYLNLEFNKIVEFPSATNDANCSYRLKELRLAYNYVSEIGGEFLSELSELQSVDLSYNRLHNVSARSFTNLRELVYLSLVGNVIEYIADGAFRDLPRLEILDLQENSLVEFSTGCLMNVSNEETELSVNVSRNRISSLVGGIPVLINILDLSHNSLESLSKAFFDSLGPHLRQLLVAHNRLTQVEGLAGAGGLPGLQVLGLQHNNISAVKRRAFSDTPALQVLDLSHNRLAQLSGEQFQALRRLRHLRLRDNELRAIPRDALRHTVLEHLDLGANRLAALPAAALAAVGFTLRRLDLADNRLERLDAAALRATPFLLELDLARNALTVLPDNALVGLPRLRALDLSRNALEANYRELLHSVPRLRRLALAGAGLRVAPPLPLRDLVELDLADNRIAALREPDLRALAALRALDLAGNALTSLQPAAWAALPRLVSLDLSRNPIVRVSRGSLEGLGRLRRLRLADLRHLEALEPRALRPLPALRSLVVDSPAGRGATLASLAAEAPGLEELAVLVREDTLDDQLVGVRAPRLRALELSGAELRHVSARAFTSLGAQRALALRLTRTRVATLPAGLVRPLARVPHLALDLSDNELVALSPAVLYPNLTGWNRLATKLLPGEYRTRRGRPAERERNIIY